MVITPIGVLGEWRPGSRECHCGWRGVFGNIAPSSGTGPQSFIDAWSNTIVNDAGTPLFRLVAIAPANSGQTGAHLATTLTEKDVLLKELLQGQKQSSDDHAHPRGSPERATSR